MVNGPLFLIVTGFGVIFCSVWVKKANDAKERARAIFCLIMCSFLVLANTVLLLAE